MSEQSSNCSEDRLRSLLQSDDDLGDDSQLAATHIAACQSCQSRLEELAAAPDEWSEARESLLSGDDHGQGRRAAMSSRPWARRRWQHRTTAWTESMSRQLLSPPSHPEMLGRIGRYEVERLIGAGGMGVVFKAFDTELNRPVAVKVLAPILAGSGAARQRFAREARAAAAVVHEHVVSIHNVETEGESPFLVMQYVAGESLQGRIDHEGALDVCEILRIGMQTAAGLAAAHAQGLVHRDVKPSNILLEKGVERALLTDFGLARASDDASLTNTGYHPGTPQYMSPEQARGEGVDARSDLFSLGSVLYTMCTGRPPFRAETSYGILRRITDTEPRSIREINPNIPDWLESIVAKLMAKQADERFASADEVAELLEDCLAHVQQPTTVPLPESCRSLFERHNEDQQTAAGPRFPRKPPSSALRLVMGAAAALTLLFAGILIVLELNKGTLAIESEADDVPIRIMQGEEVVEQMTVTKSGKSVRITAGKYRIEIAGEFPELSVVNGVVSMKRGETETVTIAISHSTTVGQKREPMNSELPTPSSRLLVDVVRQFNEVHQKADDVGHKQPLLTDDEVIAAVRSMSHQIGDLDISESEYRILRNAIERGYFPNDWTIDSSNYFQLRDGRAGERWRVQLTLRRDGSARRTFTFRSRYVRIEPEPPASTQPLPAGNVSLADWVAKVNEPEPAIYLSLPDLPVTEQEIIAALTDLVDRNQSAEFAPQRKALLEIIKTRSLPEKAELTLFRPQRHPGIVSRWANREGFENRDWTLRLKYPYRQGEKEIVTAAIIGFRLIDSRPVDHVTEDEIHWGAPAADGLQFGVAVEDGVLDQESYPALAGSAYYQPHFYLRNLGRSEMTFVQLPPVYEHYEMDVRTATGEQLPMKQRQGSYGTSILNLPDQLNGESRIHKNAYSFVVGNYATRFFEDSLSLEPPDPNSYENFPAYAINAPLNTPLRVRISIPHPTLRDSTQLMSGEMRLPALAGKETVPGGLVDSPATDEPIPQPPRDPLFENLSPQQQVSLTDPPLWVRNVPGPPGELDWPQRTGPIVLDNERLLIGQSVLDLRTGKEIERLPLATDEFAPTYLRLSADRKFLMVCGQTIPPVGVFLKPDAVIQVWDIAQRKQIRATIGTQLLPITWNGSIADISADGKVVAAGGRSGKIALWSVVDGQLLKEAPFKSRRLDAIALSPDGQWLVSSDTNDLTYWKWQTNEEPRTIHVGRKIDSLAFSPDSCYLAEGPDVRGDIQIRDMTTLEVIQAVKDKAGSPLIVCAAALKFSADGSKLIAGNEVTVDWRKLKIPYRLFIWDVESGKLLRQIATPNHLVRGVDISPDGKHIAARLDSSYVAVWSTETEEVSGAVDAPARTMAVEIVLPHQFRMHWPGAMARSPTTARFAVPVSEPSHMRLDEIVGHLGLEIGVTIEPTDYASSDEFLKRETGMRIKISADDLAALKASKLWTFTYEKEQGTVIAVIKITAQQRPVTPIADIKELNGTWRLVDAHLVRDQALGLPFHDFEGYKSARIAIDGPEWRHVRQGNELFRTLEATYDLTASPQKVDLKFTFRESEKHERRLIELHGDELITARQVVGPADEFPASFDEPMALIEQYQRVGVVTDRSEVDEHTVSISLGSTDGIRLNQQLQVTDGASELGKVDVYEIGEYESYARVVVWSADRPIRKGDRLSPIGAAESGQALDVGFPSDAVLQEMHDLLSEETRLNLDLRYVRQFLEGGKLFAKTDAAKTLENARRKEQIEARQQEITNRLKVIHESELGDLRRVAENAGLECSEEPLYGQSSYGVIVYAQTLDRIQKDELLLFHAGSLYRTRGTIRPLRTTGNGFFLRPNVAIPSGRHIALSCIQDAEEERENVKNGFMPDSNRARSPSRAYRANVYDRQSGKLIQAEQAAANGPRAVLAEIEEAWTQRSMDVSTSRLSWTENRIYPRGEKLSPNEPEPLANDLTIAWYKKLIIAGDKCRIEGIGKTWDFRVRQMAPFEFTAVRNHTGSSYHNYPDQTDNLGYFSESLEGLADVTYRPALLGTNPGDPDFGRIDLADYHVVSGVAEINGRKCIKLESSDNRTIDNQLFLDRERQFVVTRSISSMGAQVTRQLDLSYKQDSRGIWYPASWQFQVLNGNLDRHAIHITVVTTEFDSDFVASPEDFEIQYQPGTLIYDQRTQGTTVKLRVQEDGSLQATSNTDSREDGRELQDPNVISPSLKTPTTDWESTSHDLESYRIDLVPFESRSRQLWDSSPTINEE